MKTKIILFIAFILLLSSSVFGLTNIAQGSIMHASQSGARINFGNTTTTDFAMIDNHKDIILDEASFNNYELGFYTNSFINYSTNATIDIREIANLTSSNNETKIINSSITNNITNVNITVDVTNCDTIHTLQYLRNTSTSNFDVLGNGNYYCTNNRLTLNSLTLDPGENTISVSYAQTGIGGGGGSTTGISGNPTNLPEVDKFYNRTRICEMVQEFVQNHTINNESSFTLEDYNNLKARIAIDQGFGIDDILLVPFIKNFSEACPDFLNDNNTTIIIPPEVENLGTTDYTTLWIIIFVVAIAILIALYFINKNLKSSLGG